MLMIAMTTPLAAQGWIEPGPGRPEHGVIKLRTSVMVRVDDRIATVEVEEWFRNDGPAQFGEGDYVYPLPGEAVFGNFSLFQGDQELLGETMDADKARKIYEEIVRRKKDPALIEMVGKGMLRARVFPISPGETRKITLRYTQVLERAGDAMQFRYAAGGAYIGHATPIPRDLPPVRPGRDPARDRAVRGQVLHGGHQAGPPLTFTLIAEQGNVYRDAFSPTHDVRVTRDRGRMEVRPADDMRGDFALFLPFAERPVGLTLVTHRPSGEDGFFMLTLSPGEAALERVSRDITAVVDVSGSMSGEKMEQARAALRHLMGTLGRNDRFRLIRFSSMVSTYVRSDCRAGAFLIGREARTRRRRRSKPMNCTCCSAPVTSSRQARHPRGVRSTKSPERKSEETFFFCTLAFQAASAYVARHEHGIQVSRSRRHQG
jgi:Ca-activated chloride channel family protein